MSIELIIDDEVSLGDTALRTSPRLRNIDEFSSCWNPTIFISERRIIDISTGNTEPLLSFWWGDYSA